MRHTFEGTRTGFCCDPAATERPALRSYNLMVCTQASRSQGEETNRVTGRRRMVQVLDVGGAGEYAVAAPASAQGAGELGRVGGLRGTCGGLGRPSPGAAPTRGPTGTTWNHMYQTRR